MLHLNAENAVPHSQLTKSKEIATNWKELKELNVSSSFWTKNSKMNEFLNIFGSQTFDGSKLGSLKQIFWGAEAEVEAKTSIKTLKTIKFPKLAKKLSKSDHLELFLANCSQEIHWDSFQCLRNW